MPSTSDLLAVTKESAQAGAAVAAKHFRTELAVEQKSSKTDVVTTADRTAQRAVADRINETFPNDTIYGEEGTTATAISETGRTWVIDPIDGTNNYVRGNRRWTTSVACLVNGQVVTAVNILPMMDDTYVATTDGVYRNGEQVSVSDRVDMDCFRVVPTFWWGFERRNEFIAVTKSIIQRFSDMHRIGSTQAALSLLAAGSFEGVITNVMTNPWDTIAGAAMVEWAGGTVTDLEGNPWSHDTRGLVASNGQAHQKILEAAQAGDSVANL